MIRLRITFVIFCGIYDETHPHFRQPIIRCRRRGNCNEGNHDRLPDGSLIDLVRESSYGFCDTEDRKRHVHRVGFGTPFDKYLPTSA